jgi:hypothetical protein
MRGWRDTVSPVTCLTMGLGAAGVEFAERLIYHVHGRWLLTGMGRTSTRALALAGGTALTSWFSRFLGGCHSTRLIGKHLGCAFWGDDEWLAAASRQGARGSPLTPIQFAIRGAIDELRWRIKHIQLNRRPGKYHLLVRQAASEVDRRPRRKMFGPLFDFGLSASSPDDARIRKTEHYGYVLSKRYTRKPCHRATRYRYSYVNASISELYAWFRDVVVRRTRFGGIHLVRNLTRICEIHFDMWPLNEPFPTSRGDCERGRLQSAPGFSASEECPTHARQN